MSVDTNFYIGPAIIIPYKLIPYKETVFTCTNTECKRHGNWVGVAYKHCSDCGSKNEDIEFPSQRQFTLYELLEEYNLIDSVWVNIRYQEKDDESPTINIMNFHGLHPDIEEGYLECSIDQITKYMNLAKNHEQVKKVLDMLDKENIEYEFKFIAVTHYN